MSLRQNLTSLEVEIIGFFVDSFQVLRQPRSMAEIYGLLFASNRPLAMDDLINKLGLSKGSASQGLKTLREHGAIKAVYVAGDRRVHYESNNEIQNIAGKLLETQIVPHLNGGAERIKKIRKMLDALPQTQRDPFVARLQALWHWQQQSEEIVPGLTVLLRQPGSSSETPLGSPRASNAKGT